jgi:hypothetical protein
MKSTTTEAPSTIPVGVSVGAKVRILRYKAKMKKVRIPTKISDIFKPGENHVSKYVIFTTVHP